MSPLYLTDHSFSDIFFLIVLHYPEPWYSDLKLLFDFIYTHTVYYHIQFHYLKFRIYVNSRFKSLTWISHTNSRFVYPTRSNHRHLKLRMTITEFLNFSFKPVPLIICIWGTTISSFDCKLLRLNTWSHAWSFSHAPHSNSKLLLLTLYSNTSRFWPPFLTIPLLIV